jgi:hypothetical protein
MSAPHLSMNFNIAISVAIPDSSGYKLAEEFITID